MENTLNLSRYFRKENDPLLKDGETLSLYRY